MKYCPICTTDYADTRDRCPQDGARLIDRDEWAPGTVIRNKYRIVSCIGRGGMGIVYKAEHLVFKDLWALKVMNPRLSQEAEFVRRFYFEAEKQRRLKHRNVVRVDDVDQADDGRLFIGMEFVDGMPLREMLHAAQGPLAVPLALAITRGVAEALEAADALGIVHRDIKPDNVLLERGQGGVFTPKLTDFGVAKLREGTATMSKAPLLTPQYAAPEQWQPRADHPVDGRTDLYALGMTLYEMLAGRMPFNVSVDREWMYAHLNQVPPPPSHFNPEITDQRVDALVLQLLEKDPDKRPASARALLQALNLLEAAPYRAPTPAPAPAWGEATIVTPPPEPTPPAAPAPARRISSRTIPSTPAPEPAPPPPPRSAPVSARAKRSPTAPPSARAARPPTAPPPRKTPSRYREEVAPPEPIPEPAMEESRELFADVGGASSASTSRGRWTVLAILLILGVAGGGVYFWPQISASFAHTPAAPTAAANLPPVTNAPPLDGAAPTTAVAPQKKPVLPPPEDSAANAAPTAPAPAGPPTEPVRQALTGHSDVVLALAFDPRGRWLASGGEDMSVRLWDYAANRLERTIPLDENFIDAVAFSPNGRQLAIGDWNKNIKIIQVATGNVLQTLNGHTDVVEAVAFNHDGARLASASDDRTVRLWNVATGAAVPPVLKGHSGSVLTVAFSPNGSMLASGGDDQNIMLWNLSGGSAPRTFSGHSAPVRAVAFDPNGGWLASGSEDHTVRIWNLASGSSRALTPAGREIVTSVAFSPNGLWLAAGSADNQVRVWDTATWSLLATLPAGGGGVRAVGFSADSHWLAAACGDHTVRLWRRPHS